MRGFHSHCFAGRLLDRFDIKFSTYLPQVVSKHSEVTQLNKLQGFFFHVFKRGQGLKPSVGTPPPKLRGRRLTLAPPLTLRTEKLHQWENHLGKQEYEKKDGLNFSAHVTDAFSMADQKRLHRGLCPSLTHFLSAMRSTRL